MKYTIKDFNENVGLNYEDIGYLKALKDMKELINELEKNVSLSFFIEELKSRING